MKDKIYFLVFLIGCIILILSIMVTSMLILTEIKENEQEKEDWNQYDSYIFSIVWPPSSCFSNNFDNECFNIATNLNIINNFTIHGLWPIFKSGRNPEPCNKDKEINITFEDEDYKKILSLLWPQLHTSEKNIWTNEYNKYGYCYIKRIGKNPEKDYKLYFDKAKEIIDGYGYLMEATIPNTPKGLHNITKTKFKLFISEYIKKINPFSYSLICVRNESNNTDILNEIRFYYDLNFSSINNIKSTENCPEKFQIYFDNDTRKPVYQLYDSYTYTLSWNAFFCYNKGKECYKKLKEKELNIFMIQGLWPSLKSKQPLQWCNIDEDIQIEINDFPDDLKNNMKKYWIGVEISDKELWNFVYNKHGYCYIQREGKNVTNYVPYFNKTIFLYNWYELQNIFEVMYPSILPGLRKINTTSFIIKLNEVFGNNTFGLACEKLEEDKYFLRELRLKIDINTFNITKEGGILDNCPPEFYLEILDKEGPQKQAEGFYEVYDMYFLTILWLGTTCHMKGEECYENIVNVPKNTFTIHGLWPSFRNGTLTDWCNGKNDIDIEINDKELSKFMNTYYVSGYHTNEYFWGHEYNKYGYCYNQRKKLEVNNYEIYFKKVKDMFISYNFANIFLDIYKDRITPGDMEINRNEVESYFEEKNISKDTYLLVCTNITDMNITQFNPHLLEIRIRFDLEFNLLKNETDTSEFDCPEIFYAHFL